MLLKIGLYFLLLVLNYGLTWWLLHNRKLWLRLTISFVVGFLLTWLAIFFLNDARYIDQPQTSLLKRKLHINNHYMDNGYAFIKDRFVIVDNGYDKQLIDRPDIAADSSNSTITDRKRLTEFFRFANMNIDHIDLVICDIGFDMETPVDSALKAEMYKTYFSKKLLVSLDEQKKPENIFRFDSLIEGNVREAANDTRFISHTIKPGNHQSLAYKIYAFENKTKSLTSILGRSILLEKDSNNRSDYVLNNFIPRFSLTDEGFLIDEAPQEPSVAYADSGKVADGYNWISLGTTNTQEGQKDLLLNLEGRKAKGLKNYLLLGTFKNPDEDIHHTIYKPVHGVTILLNIFYDLHSGINRISFMDIFLLLTGFSVITFCIISLSLRGHNKHKRPWYVRTPIYKKINAWITKALPRCILIPLKFIFFEKLHYIFLVILFIMVARYTGLVFNIMYFAIYFLFFEISMKYYVKRLEPEN